MNNPQNVFISADPGLPDSPEALLAHKALMPLESQLLEGNPLEGIPNLKNGESLTPDDVSRLWKLLRERLPENKGNAGLYRHIALTAAKAVRIDAASPHKTVALADAAAIGLLRNLGMLLGVREYSDKSVATIIATEQLGVHQRLRNLLLPADAYITPPEFSAEHQDDDLVAANVQRIQDLLSDGQRLLEMAGLLAKQGEGGKLLTFKEIIKMHIAAFEKELDEASVISASSLAAQKNVRQTRLHESYTKLYNNWHDELLGSGVPMHRLNQGILEDASVEDPKNLDADTLMETTLGFLAYASIADVITKQADALIDALKTSNDLTRPALKEKLEDVRRDLLNLCMDRYDKDDDKMDARDDYGPVFKRINEALKEKELVGRIDKMASRGAVREAGETGKYFRDK